MFILLMPAVLYLDCGAVPLQMMSKGFILAEIDKLKQFSEYCLIIEEEPQPELQERPAKRSKKETVKAKPKSSKPKAALEKYIHEEEQEMDESLYDALIGKGIAVAQDYNLADLSQLSKLTDHLSNHGGWELFLTPKDGQCMFSSIRRGMAAPEEYRSNHLRYQIVYFITQNHGFCFTVLKTLILAEYGHIRLSQEDFVRKMMDDTITEEEEERQKKPGPFSFVTYLQALLESTFWGDHGVICMVSMMWQVPITLLTAETLKLDKVRHDRPLEKTDLLLIRAGHNHYLGACEYPFLLLSAFLVFRLFSAECVASAWPVNESARPVRKCAWPSFSAFSYIFTLSQFEVVFS